MNDISPANSWRDEELFLIAERGHLLHQQGRLQEAAVLFEGLLAIDPRNRYCAHALAVIRMKTGRAEDAVTLLDRQLAIQPNDDDTRIVRCEALIECGRLDEARNEWRLLWSRRRDPRLSRLSLRLGVAAPQNRASLR